MMDSRFKTGGALFLCLLGGGCEEAAKKLEEAAGKLEPTKLEPVTVEPAKTCGPGSVSRPAELCPPGRVVGQFGGGCPSPYKGDPPPGDHWIVEEVFEGVDDLPAGLEGYCRYVWTGAPGTEGELPPQVKAKAKGPVSPDCRVFPQSPMATDMNGAYADAFAQGTRPLPSSPSDGYPVAIAVVDTAPPSASLDQATHGQVMAAIAGELAAGCVPKLGHNTTGCRREVSTWLGLPQTVTGPDPTNGGFFGYQSDLALGIMDAVSASYGSDQKLVVNLSVGWEPEPDEFGAPTPAVQAVRDAIAIARCRGALVVAASGNRPVGTCFDQPTGPGGWESQPGPSAAQCNGLGIANPAVPNPLPAYYPFLYAATPTDWLGNNLASYREGSNARLAATGFAGFEEIGNDSFGPTTGSSVSTAVISGTAALVWSYFYGLNADEVMDLLYQSGTPTQVSADLHAGQGGAPQQHQITACGALTWVCDGGRVQDWLRGSQTRTPTVCMPGGALASCSGAAPSVDVSAWSNAFTLAFGRLDPGESASSEAPKWTTLECTQCGATQVTQLPPDMQTEPEYPGWVLPQPYKAACPLCHVGGTDLYLSLDPDYDNFTLNYFSVYLYDSAGNSEVLHYAGSDLVGSLNSRTVVVVPDTELQTVAGGQAPIRAEIAMNFTDPTTSRPITASNTISVL